MPNQVLRERVVMKRLAVYFFLLLLTAGMLGGALALSHVHLPRIAALEDLRRAIRPTLREKGSWIAISSEGAVSQEMMDAVEIACKAFNSIMQKSSGAMLEEDVRLVVSATSQDYRSALQREFAISAAEAEDVANVSGGWTGGKARITVLNGSAGVMANRSLILSTTGHELFHQLQYELSDGKDTGENAIFWLEEGSADVIGACIAEKLGGQGFEKWKRDRMYEMGSVYEYIRPESLARADGAKRKRVMGKDQHAYLISDLMTICLLEQKGADEAMANLAEYFRALGGSEDGAAAFEQVFGRKEAVFLQEFGKWLAEKRERPAKIDIVAQQGTPDGMTAAVAGEMEHARQFFRSEFGTDLHGEYQVIIAANQTDFTDAIQNTFAVPQEKASEFAQNLWVESSSTVLMNGEQLGTSQQQIFTVGAMTTRMLEGQTASGHVMGIEWMGRGIAYYVATQMMVRAGIGTLPQYRTAWRQRLASAGANAPVLAELHDAAGWNQVQGRGNGDAATCAAELAVDRLASRYGTASLYRWMRETGRTQDAREAFKNIYGVSLEQFEREFAMMR